MSTKPVPPDFDLRVPAWVLVFGPVVIALLTLLISLSGDSVFYGFSENQPGTWMSLTLMLSALMLVLPAIRNPALTPELRRIAVILSAIIAVALMDEKSEWHEALGVWFGDLFGGVSEVPLVVYADDVLIILLAVIGSAVLWKLVKDIPNARDYLPYVGLIVVGAVAHGVLDLLGHRHYIWQMFWPDLTLAGSEPLRLFLGFFEESAKLWTEYFVILFLLRLFYQQSAPLGWTLLTVLGAWMATAGLWSVTSGAFAPYMIMGTSLRFLRNYPAFFSIALLWLAWTVFAWWRSKGDRATLSTAGLLFVWPLVHSPIWLLLVAGVGVGLATQYGWRPKRRVRIMILAGCIAAFGVVLASSARPYLTQRAFSPPESVLFSTGRQLILEIDR
jgi:phage shock protein PspC (stress-responsive transcriptional regulator)